VLPFKQYRRDESSSSRKQRRRVGVALKGYALLPKVVFGVKFNDGIEVVRSPAQTAAAYPACPPRLGDSSDHMQRFSG
jgi:hypothetical protein